MKGCRIESRRITSIVTTCFKREHLIKRPFISTLKQTFKDREIIVVDDGSSNSSVRAIKSLGCRERLICQENQGLASAQNCGLRAAKDMFILFLDSDDSINSDSIESLIKLSHSTGLVFGPFAFEK
ncbi:MAG: glycosyltransferase family A protein [Pseudomonadota bacterium]